MENINSLQNNGHKGGGLYILNSGNLSLNSIYFAKNTAKYGGAGIFS